MVCSFLAALRLLHLCSMRPFARQLPSILFFLMLCFFSLQHIHAAQSSAPAKLILSTEAEQECYEKIDAFFPEPFELATLTFDSDVYLSQKEFYYLTDLHQGALVDADMLKSAVFYLIKKNKFSAIEIHVTPCVSGNIVHIGLRGFWTLAHVRIHGVLMGKEKYKQYYIMEPGDPVEKTKHQLSVEKIKDAFKQQGYFNIKVRSSFDYDYKTKSITVHLTLDKGNQFSISTSRLTITSDGQTSEDEQELSYVRRELHSRFLKHLAHTLYNKSLINQQAEHIKRFLIQEGFLNVTIQLDETIDYFHETVALNVHIDVHQKRLFIFWGNHFLSTQYLRDKILLFGKSAWLLPASILAEEITAAYYKKGFWHAQVESQEEGDRYFFLIKEGGRASIDEVQVRNLSHVSQNILIKKCFKTLLKRRYFSQHELAKSLDAVIDFYLKEGFLSAKIVNYEFEPRSIPDSYTLIVILDEGKRSHIKSISIPLFPELEQSGPFGSFGKTHHLVPFTPMLMQEQRRWLLDHFRKSGYVHLSVKPDIKKDENADIDLAWHIDLGSQKVHFGKTVILGSSTFPCEYLLRELQYHPGDIWDQDKLRESFLQLKELAIFETIQLYPFHTNKLTFEQPIMLKIKKDDPFELRVRAGLELQYLKNYQTFAGLTYKVGGDFLIKNPFNVGDLFVLKTDFTGAHREIVAKYYRPWLFTIPVRTLFQGYSIKHEHPGFIGSDKNIYTVTQNGFLIGLHKKRKHYDGELNLGFEWMKTTISEASGQMERFAIQVARAINFEPTLLGQRIPFFFIESTILIDFLDHRLNPRCGAFTLLSLKGMFPVRSMRSDSYFVKFLVEQSVFFPIGPVVGALRLRFGHIFHRQFNAIMPTERFYLGGAHSLRSFDTDFAPPLGIVKDDEGKELVVPRGGKSMVNFNAEIRIPLSKALAGVIFQDFGILSGDNFADFKAENLLAGTGFGLRYNTAVGPLRFDIGFKWRVPKPLKRSYAWSLAFGHAF